jgi:hypothetical protein
MPQNSQGGKAVQRWINTSATTTRTRAGSCIRRYFSRNHQDHPDLSMSHFFQRFSASRCRSNQSCQNGPLLSGRHHVFAVIEDPWEWLKYQFYGRHDGDAICLRRCAVNNQNPQYSPNVVCCERRALYQKTVGYCWRTPFKVLGVLFPGKFPQLFCLQRRHVGHINFGTFEFANSIRRFVDTQFQKRPFLGRLPYPPQKSLLAL